MLRCFIFYIIAIASNIPKSFSEILSAEIASTNK